jgi:putative serine protease XkdF
MCWKVNAHVTLIPVTMRKIKRAHITTIALCKRPKNGLRTVLKADGTLELATLSKAGEDNELLAVVYAPDRVDADNWFADAATIKEMAHEYQRDHRNLDIQHDGHLLSPRDAYLAESFIVAKGDERFQDWKDHDNNSVGDLTGAWGIVVKIEDPDLRATLKKGELDGVSMFGMAALEPSSDVGKANDAKAASKRVAQRLGATQHNTEEPMALEKADLQELFNGFATTLTTSLTKALEPVTKARQGEEGPKDKKPVIEAPVFKGDPTKDKDLESFEKELVAYEIKKGMADGTLTAEKIREMRAALAETLPSDEEAEIKKSDSAEVKDLKRQIFKAKKRSNTPEAGQKSGGNDGDDEQETIKAQKEDGRAIANLIANKRGYQLVKSKSA